MSENNPAAPVGVSVPPTLTLSDRHRKALKHFVRFWGEMASQWGINRTMAQIHALLYAMEHPLDMETIMQVLEISRGNASMNLRSLQEWKLVRKVSVPGTRRDYFTAEKDVWTITALIIREREKREIRPVKKQLLESKAILLADAATDCTNLQDVEKHFCERIDQLIALMAVFEGFSSKLLPLIDARNAPLIRQMIRFAESLQPAATENPENENDLT